jgi:hypothetical protein
VIAIASMLVADTAGASVPPFAAKCPNGQITAQSGGVYIDITAQGSQPPRVTYTAKDKSFGACEVVSFAPPAGHAAAASGSHRSSAPERAGQGRFDARGPVDCAERQGQPMQQCQADGNMSFHGSNRGGVYFIEAGDKRYEIVEAFVFGG